MFSENGRIDLGDHVHVSAVLAGPDHTSQTNGAGLIFAHGAGNDMNNPLIVALAEGLAIAGCVTLRFNFPYKEKGKKSPDSQQKLIHTWPYSRSEADVHRNILEKCVAWLGQLE